MKKIPNLEIQSFFVITLSLVLVSSGCVMRSYTVVKERPDREISGNQGYLLGKPSETKERGVKTRKTYVLEVELGKSAAMKNKALEETAAKESASESGIYSDYDVGNAVISTASAIEEAKDMTLGEKTYVVKERDTLEKIAARPEIYGDKKKWYKIYKANKDQIKKVDRIYPGQVLRIPE